MSAPSSSSAAAGGDASADPPVSVEILKSLRSKQLDAQGKPIVKYTGVLVHASGKRVQRADLTRTELKQMGPVFDSTLTAYLKEVQAKLKAKTVAAPPPPPVAAAPAPLPPPSPPSPSPLPPPAVVPIVDAPSRKEQEDAEDANLEEVHVGYPPTTTTSSSLSQESERKRKSETQDAAPATPAAPQPSVESSFSTTSLEGWKQRALAAEGHLEQERERTKRLCGLLREGTHKFNDEHLLRCAYQAETAKLYKLMHAPSGTLSTIHQFVDKAMPLMDNMRSAAKQWNNHVQGLVPNGAVHEESLQEVLGMDIVKSASENGLWNYAMIRAEGVFPDDYGAVPPTPLVGPTHGGAPNGHVGVTYPSVPDSPNSHPSAVADAIAYGQAYHQQHQQGYPVGVLQSPLHV
jgi:hypothetical protein